MRHITTIPVFGRYPGTGYGYDEETKAMLGDYTWGDVHHPGLSKSNGLYDGRWLFVNDNANNRVARIDLRDFKTKQILGPIPNSMGNHGSSFVTDNTEYVLVATRFSTPLPKGRYADPADYEKEFNGAVSGIRVDPQTGTMSVGWQILTPPFDWDLGSTGKGPSSGWAFWTSYNTEMAHTNLEVAASQHQQDFITALNWKAAEQAVAAGKFEMIGGAKVIDAIETALSLHQGTLEHERAVIADYGNMSSPTALFVLERNLAKGLPRRSLLAALGPGFTASCVSLRRAA